MKLLIPLLSLVSLSSGFIIKPLEAAAYSDATARNKMLALSAAAYSKTPQNCLTNVFKGQLKRQVNVKCDAARDTCSGFTAVLDSEKAIVVSFRGTDEFLQLIAESDSSVLKDQVAWPAGGKVSKYFYKAFMDVWNGGMKDDFSALRNAHPTYQVWVTGHSLGGAMASLAASWIVNHNLASASNVFLYTYGQPRTGNKDWASAHDSQGFTSTFRLTHSRDVVPHVPPENLEGYRHHNNEVFYHNNMGSGASYVICNNDEDKKCSDGLDITLSISDHLHYFGKDISGWGDKGCK